MPGHAFDIFGICVIKYKNWLFLFSYWVRISMASALKNTKIELELLTDIDMLLLIEKFIRIEYAMLFVYMQNPITNTWKIMIKIKNHHILSIET